MIVNVSTRWAETCPNKPFPQPFNSRDRSSGLKAVLVSWPKRICDRTVPGRHFHPASSLYKGCPVSVSRVTAVRGLELDLALKRHKHTSLHRLELGEQQLADTVNPALELVPLGQKFYGSLPQSIAKLISISRLMLSQILCKLGAFLSSCS